MNDEDVMEYVRQCYTAVAKGGTKVGYESEKLSVTAYRVVEIIRIDIKIKTN